MDHTSAVRERVCAELRRGARPDSRFHFAFGEFIADFEGSEAANARLMAHRFYRDAQCIFITPDNCIEELRHRALLDGKRVLVTTYSIKRGFWLLDAARIPADRLLYAATLDGMDAWNKGTHGKSGLIDRVKSARDAGAQLCIRGGGTKEFYGEAPRGEVLDTRILNGTSSYEPTELVVTTRCGTSLTALEAMRAQLNDNRGSKPKLTLLPLLIAAICRALPDFPMINARYDDEAGIVTRSGAVHLGLATQTDAGLMVPVIRNAESLNIWQIAAEITRLAEGGSAEAVVVEKSTFVVPR